MNRRYDKYRTHHRSRRLAGHDYAASGWYFVTICTKGRACFFGAVRSGIVGLSGLGTTAHRCWAAIPDHFGHAQLDAYVVMPNHVHGIVGLLPQGDGDANDDDANDDAIAPFHETARPHRRERSQRKRSARRQPTPSKNKTMADRSPASGSLAVIVRQYKGAVTRWARRNGPPDFAWQPRFHDHIVRSERSLQRIRRYIFDNPLKWKQDRNHPANGQP